MLYIILILVLCVCFDVSPEEKKHYNDTALFILNRVTCFPQGRIRVSKHKIIITIQDLLRGSARNTVVKFKFNPKGHQQFCKLDKLDKRYRNEDIGTILSKRESPK